jgi:dipeptidyl aminopeptidase/acylaminoacyl peptidase
VMNPAARTSLVLFPLVLVAAAAAQEPATHPFSVHDMLAMQRISDPQVSPDGSRVLFNVRSTDLEANRGRTDLWVASVDGSRVRRLTTHEAADFNGRWSADGKSVWFLSTRGGSAQVWRLAIEGGEAQPVTDLPVDVTGLVPFRDGERLALTLEVYPDAADLAETAARDAQAAKDPVKGRVYDELLFRHWDAWEDGKRNHVFVWSVDGGEPVDLLKGLDVDAPTRPFGGVEEIAVHPDGSTVVFAAKLVGREAAWSTDVDLWAAPADGSAPPRCLTEANAAYDNGASFSPDGKRLAWTSMARPGYEADRLRVTLMDWPSGTPRVISEAWDRSAGALAWSADGRTLYTSAANLGQESLFAVDVASGAAQPLVVKGSNSSVAPAGARLVLAHDDLKSPVELFSCALDGSDVKPITRLNAERVAAARMGDYEQFTFQGAHGDTVHGYVLKPADFQQGTKYPVAFLIHGGPQGSFGDHFHYRWNPQAYAGAGYAAVFIDFHGSTGYGQAFTDAIRGDWGGAPYEDLMKGLDHALATYPFLDGERVAALGASYGGYMVNWIAGQTDRFECLVSHDGNLDEQAAYFMTEELWFPEWEHGTPWANPESYAKHNPIDHVAKWKSPILVIHGALDYRVVDTQGMASFTAAQRLGVPSRLLYFPDENHWVLKPKNSILWHETVLGWLEQWIGATER